MDRRESRDRIAGRSCIPLIRVYPQRDHRRRHLQPVYGFVSSRALLPSHRPPDRQHPDLDPAAYSIRRPSPRPPRLHRRNLRSRPASHARLRAPRAEQGCLCRVARRRGSRREGGEALPDWRPGSVGRGSLGEGGRSGRLDRVPRPQRRAGQSERSPVRHLVLLALLLLSPY